MGAKKKSNVEVTDLDRDEELDDSSEVDDEEGELELSDQNEESDASEDEEKEDQKPDDDFHSDDAIKHYLREIQRTTLLTAEEEKQLARRISKGDMAARDHMIESNRNNFV